MAAAAAAAGAGQAVSSAAAPVDVVGGAGSRMHAWYCGTGRGCIGFRAQGVTYQHTQSAEAALFGLLHRPCRHPPGIGSSRGLLQLSYGKGFKNLEFI